MTLEKLNEFFKRTGINKSGICKESGISSVQFLDKMLKGHNTMTDATKDKLIPVIESYGGYLALSKAEIEFLLDLLWPVEDVGPKGEGWKSQELEYFIKKLEDSLK